MPENDSERGLNRRTVLKRTAAAGAALTVGSGMASADTQDLDVEVWISDDLTFDIHEDAVRDAGSDIESHADVNVNFQGIHGTDAVYDGNQWDIYDTFRTQEFGSYGQDQVNLLIFKKTGTPGCNHNGNAVGEQNPPIAILNGMMALTPDRTYKNLVITAMLRPVLDGQQWRAPDSSDINSFGTVHTDMGFTNEASPLATWHEPRQPWCPSFADLDDLEEMFEGEETDHLNSMCDGRYSSTEDIPQACDHTGRLSECTANAIHDQIAWNL